MTPRPRPTARQCEQCKKQSPAAISYYRLTTPGQWLCFRCAKRAHRLAKRLTSTFRDDKD